MGNELEERLLGQPASADDVELKPYGDPTESNKSLRRRISGANPAEYDERTASSSRWRLLDEHQARHQVEEKYVKADTSEYSSFDFNQVENEIRRERDSQLTENGLRLRRNENNKVNLLRWMFCFTIAVAMGFTGFFTDLLIYYANDVKYNIVFGTLAGDCREEHGKENVACRSTSWFVGLVINVTLVLIAAYTCNKLSLASAGSGIGEIKCYLNGIRHKDWLSFNTYISKVVGVICGVTAGMPIGKEGPMIHTGAILGAGVSQAKNSRYGVDFGFDVFRNDRDKRDFVAAGAAAGLCCAFGAPLGGVLFVIEEGASYLTVPMIWRCLFTATVALLVLQLLETGTIHRNGNKWGDLTSNAMFSFGQFTEPNHNCGPGTGIDFSACRWAAPTPLWTLSDIPLFLLMAIVGGLLGAMWNQVQSMITVFRIKYRTTLRRRVAEAGLIAAVNTTLLYLTAQYIDTCKPLPSTNSTPPWLLHTVRQATCEDGKYSSLATLVFNPLEIAVQEFFHQEAGTFDAVSCLTFGAIVYVMACWTYGGTYPSGIFVPSIAIGAAFGRAFGQVMLDTSYQPTNVGIYALMGAGAYLSGVTRVTISLAAIFVESTDDASILLPLTLVLIVSKWVADRFNTGIYDIHIELKHTPLLAWNPSLSMVRYSCGDAMSTPVATIQARPTVQEILDILNSTTHGAFPVVRVSEWHPRGEYLGIIMRHQLLTLLEKSAWEDDDGFSPELSEEIFRGSYHRRGRTTAGLNIPDDAIPRIVSLYPYFDASAFTVSTRTPLTRAFQIIRYLGLRHVPVVDGALVRGILTRSNVLDSTVELLDNERPTD